MRVLKWIIDRANGTVGGQETRLGWVPRPEHLDLTGLEATAEAVQQANRIDYGEWRAEVESQSEFFKTIGPTMPRTLELERELLASRLTD
jgi:phosphoenolpyruvate carboxykinase (GTP)